MKRDPHGESGTQPHDRGCPLCRSRRVTPFAFRPDMSPGLVRVAEAARRNPGRLLALAHHLDVEALRRARSARYFRCAACHLTYVAPEQRPNTQQQVERYRTHRNDPADARYRAFLSRLADPLITRLSRGAEGLGYGAGPGPTLSVMLEEQGFRMEIYDPFFAPNERALRRSYDFITCTETVEHFFFPGVEFGRLARMLRPGGWLGVMTQILEDDRDFADWYYIRDPTHVCFYHSRTMQWIAQAYGWTLQRPRQDVALFWSGA